MAGIKYLNDLFKKQGQEFIDSLFKKQVIITEMLNGSSFAWEKSGDGVISFYKKDQLNPISKIDRTLMRYYEPPIRHISNLSKEVLEEIPEGWRFGTEYFINNKPVTLSYDRTPKNNLVLTHILVKDEYGDLERTISDKKELDYWADLLQIGRPPIIFQGRMNDDQKVKIQEFISVPFDVLSSRYGTNSFAKYIISVLNPSLKGSTLNDDLDKPIEGIVFKWGSLDGQGESISAKLIDPVFAEISKSHAGESTSYFPNDIYGITILDVMNFILDKGLDDFEFMGDDMEDRYISFICDVFEKFIDENGEEYREVDFDEPSYLRGEGFEANCDNIPSEKTKALIEEESSYESLFKLILSAFRKLKKKPGGFFNSGSIEQFNILVREISDYLSQPGEVIENGIPTFGEFRRDNKTVLIEEAEESTDEDDVDKSPEKDDTETEGSDELLKKIKGSIESPDEGSTLPEEATEKKMVSIIIGDFQPFNNGDLKIIQRTKYENNFPVALMVVEPREGSDRFFLDLDIIKMSMSSVANEFKDLIEQVIYVPNNLLGTALDALPKEYEAVALTTQKDTFENYVLQKTSLVKRGKITEDFKVYSTPQWSNPSEIKELIKCQDFVNFKKNAPRSIVYLWQELIKFA